MSEAVPLLADLLSIPIDDRYPVLNSTSQQRKEKTLQVQLAQAEGLAAQQPLLMPWEGIHRSDRTSLQSLGPPARRAETRPKSVTGENDSSLRRKATAASPGPVISKFQASQARSPIDSCANLIEL